MFVVVGNVDDADGSDGVIYLFFSVVEIKKMMVLL